MDIRDQYERDGYKELSEWFSDSMQYRLGRAFVIAYRNPISLLKFPYTFFKLVKNRKQNSNLQGGSKKMALCLPIIRGEDKYSAAEIIEAVKKTEKSKVTIVVPVYNAYEEMVSCLNSIKKNTEFPYNVILVNDCSTDVRVNDFLNTYCEENDNFLCVENEKNEGFVVSINKGIRACDTDVVILNSDTVVTKDWLKKLVIAAYSNCDVMTVTPLSNAAGMFSVPETNKKNVLPENWSLDEVSKVIEKMSNHDYESVPTGNGFCMYIKRNAIREVGVFDEETFGKGYCEENDFCMRLLQKSYYNIIADDTYIFHKHNVTFKKKKNKLLRKNMDILKERYPQYSFLVHKMTASEKLENTRRKIKTVLEAADKKVLSCKRILLVTNQLDNNIEKQVEKIVAQGCECFVLERGTQQFQLYQFQDKAKRLLEQRQIEKEHNYNDRWKNMCFEVLYDKHIDAMYNNGDGHDSAATEDIVKMLNVPLIKTFDSAMICNL